MSKRELTLEDLIQGERDTLCSTAPRDVKDAAKKRLAELRAEQERRKRAAEQRDP